MQVSGALGVAAPALEVLSAKEKVETSNVDTEVARKTLDHQKAEGAQLIDMIQKSGSIIDVVA